LDRYLVSPHMCVRHEVGDTVLCYHQVRNGCPVLPALDSLRSAGIVAENLAREASVVHESTAFRACLVLRISLPPLSRYSYRYWP
jgi:hypothetical protein